MSPVFSVRGVGGGVSSELSVRDIGKEAVGNAVLDPSNRGRTDKKLTSTLVIQTFLSFELADFFFKVWESFIFQKS